MTLCNCSKSLDDVKLIGVNNLSPVKLVFVDVLYVSDCAADVLLFVLRQSPIHDLLLFQSNLVSLAKAAPSQII